MKVSKDYSDVSTMYYRPEIQNCLECESRLKRSHRVWNKYIIQLTRTIDIIGNKFILCLDIQVLNLQHL
jgi:hypothetical protein